MGRILFLGYSNLIKARILPILSRLSIKSYSIAKYEGQDWDDWDGLNTIDKYNTYEEGLNNFKGELVYVSTVNSTHFLYAKLALEYGFHVIVDKPATMEYVQASKLIEVAKQKNLLVCESTVYLYHPQFEMITLNKIGLLPSCLLFILQCRHLHQTTFVIGKNLVVVH